MHKLENERPFGVVEYGLCDPPDLIGSVAKFFRIVVLWHDVRYPDLNGCDAQNRSRNVFPDAWTSKRLSAVSGETVIN